MQEVLDILKQVGAILLDDHFVGTSGGHFATYINKDALYPHTAEASQIGKYFAKAHQDLDIDVVAAPALGGIILSQWTAYHLSKIKNKEVLGIYLEKKDGDLQLTRGYDAFVKGKKVLAIEDLTSTGASLKKVVDTLQAAGAEVVAASVMVNKSTEVTEDTFGVPFKPLAQIDIPIYDAAQCPLCQNNVPINTHIGHGKQFLEQQ